MAVFSVCGLPGKGKSWVLVFYALLLAEKNHRNVVCNFWLDLNKVAQYCKMMHYEWLLSQLDKGVIHYISANDNLADMLVVKESVIALDEAGIFAFSRNFQSMGRDLLNGLFQTRKNGQDILFACQYYNQVDVVFRELTDQVFFCNGTTYFDNKIRRDKLAVKNFHLFSRENFQQWERDPKLKKNPLKTRLLATKSYTGMLSAAEQFIFELYDSFTELEKQDNEDIVSKGQNAQGLYYQSCKVSKSSSKSVVASLNLSDSELLEMGITPKKQEEFRVDERQITIYASTGITPVRLNKLSKSFKWIYNTLPYELLSNIDYFNTEIHNLIEYKSKPKPKPKPKPKLIIKPTPISTDLYSCLSKR